VEKLMRNEQLDPSHILQTATAFWGSKALLTAVELDLFTVLGEEKFSAAQLREALSLHPRGIYDFFDALVALRFLDREGDGPEGKYKNTRETAAFLNKKSPRYIGGLPQMLNSRLFGFWNHLGAALKTGKAQNEAKGGGKSIFEVLYADQAALGEFLDAMSGVQAANFEVLAEKFDFAKYRTVSDVGGALALLSRIVGARHAHLLFTSFDLPPVVPLARKHIRAAEMESRITAVGGDFFKDELPKADVVTMGNVLHDWNLEKKKILIGKAYAALPSGGAFIVIENIIDDARRENAFGLLMSLNMLIEVGDAFDYTAADFRGWCSEAGFTRFEIITLAGPASAAVAYKP
jgi:hypothetical protein